MLKFQIIISHAQIHYETQNLKVFMFGPIGCEKLQFDFGWNFVKSIQFDLVGSFISNWTKPNPSTYITHRWHITYIKKKHQKVTTLFCD